jgi:hypothetical protein
MGNTSLVEYRDIRIGANRNVASQLFGISMPQNAYVENVHLDHEELDQ